MTSVFQSSVNYEKPKPTALDIEMASPHWAKPLAKLWQFLDQDFEAEKQYNMMKSAEAPHCAICSLFKAPVRIWNGVRFVYSDSVLDFQALFV